MGKKKRARRGRPEHKPTPALRKRVSVGAAGGMTHEEISIALGISKPTLEKHYEVELSTEAHKRKLDVLNAMFQSATGRKKNVAAQKAFIAASIALSPPPPPKPEKPAKPEKPLGKKEQQEQDAHDAHLGSEWADLLKPSQRPQ